MILKIQIIIILVFTLAACGGSSGGSASPIPGPGTPGGNGNSANSAPELTPIASINAVTGDLLRFELAGTDVDGDRLTYSSRGAVGTSNNPFVQTTPAVFDDQNGVFEWSPTGQQIGQYSVTFTVSEEDTTEKLTASITLDITVDTQGGFGQQFYAVNCGGCHGVDGTGISGPDIRLKTDADISFALLNVPAMQTVANQLSPEQVDAVAYHVLTKFSGTDFHSQFDLSNGCSGCHDGFESIGQPVTHMAATDVCQSCHSTSGFRPVNMVDHNQVIGLCASCHNGTIARAKITGHIDTNNNCEACHNTNTFRPVASVNHTAVNGICIDCHDGMVAIGKSAMHISTNNTCNACHNTIFFNLNRTIAHQNAFGFCGDCHNNVTAIGKPPGHPGTMFDCADCHDTNVF